jgi:hypothetical protein
MVLELGRWAWPRGHQAPHQSRSGAWGRSPLRAARGQPLGAQGRSPLLTRRSGSGSSECEWLRLGLVAWEWVTGDGGRLGLRDLAVLVGRGLESWVKKICKIVDGLKRWTPMGHPRVKCETRPTPAYSRGGCGSDPRAKFGAHAHTRRIGYPSDIHTHE